MRRFVRATVLLLLAAVLVAGAFALSACDKGDGKNGGADGDNSQSGGVFSPDMSYEEYIDLLYSMTNWTSSIVYNFDGQGNEVADDKATMVSVVDGTDVCCVYDMGE